MGIVAAIFLLIGSGSAEVVYSNNFNGAAGSDIAAAADVGADRLHKSYLVALNGSGHLVGTDTLSQTGLRVNLSDHALNAAHGVEAITISAVLAAPSENWIGLGVQEGDVPQLNGSAAMNSGPWLQVGKNTMTVRGGTGVVGSTDLISGTHSPGQLLSLEMTYHVLSNTVDVLCNGESVVSGLAVSHVNLSGEAEDCVVKYLTLQLYSQPTDGSVYVDSLAVDVVKDERHGELVQLANLFSSGCVLQRDQSVAIWGTCAPNDMVTLSVHDQVKTAAADGAGNWRVMLDAEPAGGPFTLRVRGERTPEAVLTDVYFGDVWILTGQSNMAATLGGQLAKCPTYYPALPDATDDLDDVRLTIITVVAADEPADDVEIDQAWSRWDAGALARMSTVGYFFARALNRALDANGMDHIPLGFIKVCKGGTAIEQWVSAGALDAMAESLISSADSSVYYNGMIAPLQGYSIKGALWYQGEANANPITRIEQYPLVFRTMVESWRSQWGNPDLPVYFVQLAAYQEYSQIPKDTLWARMRESQAECLEVENTAMACIIDTGFQGDIHPPFKDKVGDRLARIALSKTYGISTVCRGPVVQRVEINGSDVIMTFDHVADGLQLQTVDSQPDEEETAAGFPAVSVSSDELAGFALCGSDRVFYPATRAEMISTNQVRISNAADVPVPVAVRYAWKDYPRCNLFNSEGLPAEPFRTDSYEYRSSTGAAASLQ